MAYASLKQISMLLKLTPRRIDQLAKDEGFPRVARGEYDVMACVHWMIDYYRRELARLQSGGESMREAELRERKAIASIKEIELARKRGETLGTEEVMGQIQPYLKAFRERLLAFPRKAAPQLQALEKITEKERFLTDGLNEILHELASLQVRTRGHSELPQEVDARGPVASEAAATTAHQRMGRRTKKTQSRVKRRTRPVAH